MYLFSEFYSEKYCWDVTIFKGEEELEEPKEIVDSQIEVEEENYEQRCQWKCAKCKNIAGKIGRNNLTKQKMKEKENLVE